jgi:hypothetical protein
MKQKIYFSTDETPVVGKDVVVAYDADANVGLFFCVSTDRHTTELVFDGSSSLWEREQGPRPNKTYTALQVTLAAFGHRTDRYSDDRERDALDFVDDHDSARELLAQLRFVQQVVTSANERGPVLSKDQHARAWTVVRERLAQAFAQRTATTQRRAS